MNFDVKNSSQNSTVVDLQGEPLVVYHGTRTSFGEFDSSKIKGESCNEFGKGFYFTPSLSAATLYAERFKDKDAKTIIVAAHLSIKNPKFVTTNDRGGCNGWHGEHDGVIVVYADSQDRMDPVNWAEIVVARADQIRVLTDAELNVCLCSDKLEPMEEGGDVGFQSDVERVKA